VSVRFLLGTITKAVTAFQLSISMHLWRDNPIFARQVLRVTKQKNFVSLHFVAKSDGFYHCFPDPGFHYFIEIASLRYDEPPSFSKSS
jgi:hypothetical protein